MEKIVFKNHIVNIVFGSLLIIFAVVGYFLNIIEDYLPIIIGVVLILLSAKRFLFTFKKTISKNATLILIIEFILDLAFAGLLIYLQDHVELFVGLIIYTRGVSYLIINYVATRKVKIIQYLFNIGYVTFGSFLMFTSYSSVEFLSIFINSLILIIGAVYLQFGLKEIVRKEKEEEELEEQAKKKEKIEKIEAKSEKKIEQLKQEVKQVEQEKKKTDIEKKELEKKVQKLDSVVKKSDTPAYVDLTMAELKEIAKKRNITGVSQLNKSELIERLKK